MKIGIVCYPTYGGSGVVATELGKALANRDHKVHFITYRQPPRLDAFHQNIFYHEVRLANYPLFEHAPYESVLASKMVDVAIHEKLDLLHVHYAIPHAAAAFMAKQILRSKEYNIPVITTLHGTDITLVGKDITLSPVVTFSINESDGVTTVSESLKQDTYEHFEVTKPIEVIPNFIDFTKFSKKNKSPFRQLVAPNGEHVLIHISNFRKVKRVTDVIRVFEKVLQQKPAKLLLVGDGPERQKLEQLCRDLKVCDDVRFLGKQDAIEDLLAIADVFILPSEKESFGLAALEAMACEVPVISSNTGGIPEINEHGVTGFLSDVGDTDNMAQNLLKIIENDDTLAKFKANAHQRAKVFDLQKVLPVYENYYQQVIEEQVVAKR